MTNTAQRIPSRHSGVVTGTTKRRYQPFYHRLCRTGWQPPTSTTEVHQTLVRHRPFRQNNDSCRRPQPGPRLSGRCRPPGVHRPSAQPRCSPYATHNPTLRRPRRPNGPGDPPRRSPTSPLSISTTPAPPQYQDPVPRTTSAHSRTRAHPTTLTPPKLNRPAERRQVHQDHAPIALQPHRPTTRPTHRAGRVGTDHHLKRCTPTRVVDPHQINLAQAYQQPAHARRDQPPPGVLLPPMCLSNTRLWRTPHCS